MSQKKLPFEYQQANSTEEDKKRILFRSRENYMFAGIIGGLSYFWNINPTILRLLFILSVILTSGLMIIVYLILIKVIPLEPEI